MCNHQVFYWVEVGFLRISYLCWNEHCGIYWPPTEAWKKFSSYLLGFFYHSKVDHNALRPETDRNLESLKSLHSLEVNGVKVNSLGNIEQVQVEPPVPRSQLICTGYSNATVFMPISQFPVNDKKANKNNYGVLFSGWDVEAQKN